MEVKKCHQCKRKTMQQVTSFAEGLIQGWECSECGARMAYGDPYAEYGWPRANIWVEQQKIRGDGHDDREEGVR